MKVYINPSTRTDTLSDYYMPIIDLETALEGDIPIYSKANMLELKNKGILHTEDLIKNNIAVIDKDGYKALQDFYLYNKLFDYIKLISMDDKFKL